MIKGVRNNYFRNHLIKSGLIKTRKLFISFFHIESMKTKGNFSLVPNTGTSYIG